MKNYIYSSVLKDEFKLFLAIRRSRGFKDKNRYVWESLDRYLSAAGQDEKCVSALTVENWLSETCSGLSNGSAELYITSYNAFARYLATVGINAYIQDYALDMRGHRYTPYIFSSDEMDKIFAIADSGAATRENCPKSRFPCSCGCFTAADSGWAKHWECVWAMWIWKATRYSSKTERAARIGLSP